MRHAVFFLVGLALSQPLNGQSASADSAAIVALEVELSRLLAAGQIDQYATHLTSDYARTTPQGRLERRDAALASWRSHGSTRPMQPADLWVRVYGDAAVLTGVIDAPDVGATRLRITKTFVRQNGRWLLAALHGSVIPQR